MLSQDRRCLVTGSITNTLMCKTFYQEYLLFQDRWCPGVSCQWSLKTDFTVHVPVYVFRYIHILTIKEIRVNRLLIGSQIHQQCTWSPSLERKDEWKIYIYFKMKQKKIWDRVNDQEMDQWKESQTHWVYRWIQPLRWPTLALYFMIGKISQTK